MALLFGVFLALFFAMGQKWYVSIILAARILQWWPELSGRYWKHDDIYVHIGGLYSFEIG